MVTEIMAPPPISDENQPLFRKLMTRLNDKFDERLQAENDVEGDLDQLIVLNNREELEEVYGIPFIITLFLFSTHFYLNFDLYTYSATCVHLKFASNKIYFLIVWHLSFTYSHIYAINICHYITTYFSRPYHYHRLFILFDRIKSTSGYNNATYTQDLYHKYSLVIHTFVNMELLVSHRVLFCGLAVWDALSSSWK